MLGSFCYLKKLSLVQLVRLKAIVMLISCYELSEIHMKKSTMKPSLSQAMVILRA